jgi:hypothetical protein
MKLLGVNQFSDIGQCRPNILLNNIILARDLFICHPASDGLTPQSVMNGKGRWTVCFRQACIGAFFREGAGPAGGSIQFLKWSRPWGTVWHRLSHWGRVAGRQ